MCGGDVIATTKEILARHGKSPKLARRAGKPLIFGYQSWCYGMGHVHGAVAGDATPEQRTAKVDALRTSPEGWELMGRAFTDAETAVGEPIAFHYCLGAFDFNISSGVKPPLPAAAAVIAKHVQAVGGFNWLGNNQPEIAEAVRKAGAEWSLPVGMYQKENVPYECYVPKGTDWMHWGQAAIDQQATLLQIVTWNDYGENSNIAPGWNTRYAMYDLTAYEIALWKTGTAPKTDRDRIYLTYRKYPAGSPVFPFATVFNGVDEGAIEVLTILKTPAKIRLPGRDIEYDAPAGYHRQQFPVTVGPVVAEVVRGGKVALKLESPEPITDRPFREDHAMVCCSSEDERLWQEDFPGTKPTWWSEYGDADGDGLPNWFEMYWYGTFGDMATASNAEIDGETETASGRTALAAWQERVDPTLAPVTLDDDMNLKDR